MKIILVIAFLFLLFFNACSRKTHSSNTKTIATDTISIKKPKVKAPVPKVIIVNDSSARKTFDGRLYYDLEGHRYWRNSKDGKYYLYHKSMQNDDAFKAPSKN